MQRINAPPAIIPYEPIERLIRVIRGQRVILDTDLAQIYGVLTWRLNEQVKRNRDRFPADFMFQLTDAENKERPGRSPDPALCFHRSEERRVGKECRSR